MPGYETDTVTRIETNLDDVSPQVLGEHTNAVLTDVLKMSAGEIAALKDTGIL
jgi:crotonobetainyl-CoA:carnitine CoA-transferase CaiB-like acyl-CoA transferase